MFWSCDLFHVGFDQFLCLFFDHLHAYRIVLLKICLGGNLDDIVVLLHLILITEGEDA